MNKLKNIIDLVRLRKEKTITNRFFEGLLEIHGVRKIKGIKKGWIYFDGENRLVSYNEKLTGGYWS